MRRHSSRSDGLDMTNDVCGLGMMDFASLCLVLSRAFGMVLGASRSDNLQRNTEGLACRRREMGPIMQRDPGMKDHAILDVSPAFPMHLFWTSAQLLCTDLAVWTCSPRTSSPSSSSSYPRAPLGEGKRQKGAGHGSGPSRTRPSICSRRTGSQHHLGVGRLIGSVDVADRVSWPQQR